MEKMRSSQEEKAVGFDPTIRKFESCLRSQGCLMVGIPPFFVGTGAR